MLKQILLSVFTLFLISCEKDSDQNSSSNEETLISKGTFNPTSGIMVTGDAKIFIDSNTKKVVLENFTVSEGPDLKVYLSKTATPEEFINLGSLTTATVYSIPAEVDLTLYKYVLIHCQQYNHLFAIAELYSEE